MEQNDQTPEVTQEKITALEQQLAACQTASTEWKNKYLYVTADFENFKKRQEKERIQWAHTAQERVLVDLLAIVDDFDRAQEQLNKQADSADTQSIRQGLQMIDKAVRAFLAKHQVREITQTTFDPQLHEAIAQVDSPDHESGTVVAILQKGYLLKDEVLRPAKVTVAK